MSHVLLRWGCTVTEKLHPKWHTIPHIVFLTGALWALVKMIALHGESGSIWDAARERSEGVCLP